VAPIDSAAAIVDGVPMISQINTSIRFTGHAKPTNIEGIVSSQLGDTVITILLNKDASLNGVSDRAFSKRWFPEI
jgi:hypothetical protein